MTRAALALSAAALLASCHSAPPIEAHPALWRVRDADTTIWLFGTVHMLPANVHWQTPAITHAIDSADTLVTELPDHSAAITATLEKMGGAKGLPPLAARIAPARRQALTAAIIAGKLDPAKLDTMKTWAAALAIGVGAGRARNASRDNGADAVLARHFDAAHRRALETPAQQFAAFDGLPEAAQRVLLDRAIDAVSNDDADAIVAAWSAGDLAKLAATLDPAFTAAPALERALVRDRNARWADVLAARMKQPGTTLVAVGAGHFVGPDALPAMLAARGLKVERVE